ncbi:MAG: ABC transporter substrate-binding protein, partial [Desulfobulbaceae bacterium]|nr:ABC transporter substrate-binding protein [Desulfobulbaceae bacterium]
EMDLIQKNKIPFLVSWATATAIIDNTLPENYIFRLSVRDEYGGAFLAQQAAAVSPRIGLLLEQTSWGRSNEQAITSTLAAMNLTPVAVEWFNWGDTDMSLQFTRLENAKAGVILLIGNAPEAIPALKTMAHRNNTTPVVSHWGVTSGRFWQDVQQELTQIPFSFLQTRFSRNMNNDKSLSYCKIYHASRDRVDNPVPDASSTCLLHGASIRAYDLIQILALAIEKAGSTDRVAVRAALENIDTYSGLVKEYSPPFSPHNHEALDINDYQMAQFDDAGGITPVPISMQVQ